MFESLLQTKLYLPPHRPDWIVRSRLLAKLEVQRPLKLILVSAPAGYGKTTLIINWLQQQAGAAVCWLSLDEDDSDTQQFFRYLAAAVRPLPDMQSSLPHLLQSNQTIPAKTLIKAFVHDLIPVSTPFYLILDDYHAIDSAEVDGALAALLDLMPPQMTMVLTSRSDPGFPISRLRARGELIELRADEMRFTEAEAAQFLQQTMGLTLPPDQIAALEARTEGWIAGLQMAALSMQNRASSDLDGFVDMFTGSHRFIMDYLVEEALRQQPEPVRTFLLSTSILDRLCGSLCTAVTGREDSQEILESLEHSNLFIVPLDDQRIWFRYHHLFADVLQAYDKAAQPDQIAALHQRASAWYAQHGLPSEAVRHALAIDDYEQVAALAELSWRAMDRRYQSATWLGWVKGLPDELVRVRPVLCAQYAWALLDNGEMEAAEIRLRDAERWLDLDGQPKTALAEMVVVDEAEFQSLPITVANARAYLAQTLGDVADAMRHAQQALELPVENDPFEQGLSALLLGFAYWASGDLESAFQTVSDAVSTMWTIGNVPFAISFTSYLADIMLAQGRLHESIATYENALQRTTEQGKSDIPETAVLHLGLCDLHLEQGDMAAAKRHLLKSQDWGEQPAFPPWHRHWSRAQAHLKVAQGDLDGAVTLLNEGENLYFRHPVPDGCPIPALKARVWILQEKLTEAQAWAHEQGLSAANPLSYLREFEHITLARLRIAQYTRDGNREAIQEATDLLARLLVDAETGERMGSVVEILMLQALVYQEQNNPTAALVVLKRALTLAEPAGYVRMFVDEGLPMMRLLQKMNSEKAVLKRYCHTLLTALGSQAETHPSSPNPQPLVDPLSDRELEILALIAAGLKNKEIAEQLVISLNTVLYHNKNIYGKLGVNKRALAIARARELNLIE